MLGVQGPAAAAVLENSGCLQALCDVICVVAASEAAAPLGRRASKVTGAVTPPDAAAVPGTIAALGEWPREGSHPALHPAHNTVTHGNDDPQNCLVDLHQEVYLHACLCLFGHVVAAGSRRAVTAGSHEGFGMKGIRVGTADCHVHTLGAASGLAHDDDSRSRRQTEIMGEVLPVLDKLLARTNTTSDVRRAAEYCQAMLVAMK
jgi:hypothetical protein